MQHKLKYMVRRVTEDGLIKCFEEFGEGVLRYNRYDSVEEAFAAAKRKELSEAVILPVVELYYE